MMPTKYQVVLTAEQRAQLRTLVGQGVAPARLLTHARILRKADHGAAGPGWTAATSAAALDVGLSTGARLRQRCVAAGVAAALARKAPDRVYARRLDGAQEAHRIALACSPPPDDRARWTMRVLAAHLDALEVVETVSYETVRQVLKQTRSSPG